MKKVFLFLALASLCTISSFGQLSVEHSYSISKINPANDTTFPGGRGVNQLVMYTEHYGKSTTGTNDYGVEAVVRNGIVVAIGGNNSRIQKGRIILSGHGTARAWLLENAKIGADITIRDSIAVSRFDVSSFRFFARVRLPELEKKFRVMKAVLSARERRKIFMQLAVIRAMSRQSAVKQTRETADEFIARGIHMIDRTDYLITASPKVEGRGAWHRPDETTTAQVNATVKKFVRAGFNMLFVETVWGGETIYPGAITEQKQKFKGFDPLQAFIDAGKKYGVKIHAWVHTFFVGHAGPGNGKSIGPVLTHHPEWALVKRNGEKISRAEDGYLYVCPARPEVQNYLASLYHEICVKYPGLGGVQLDYVRYPVNSSLEESSCYCDYCRSAFKKFSGVDPLDIDPASHPKEWKTWQRWREDNITRFVKRVREENPKVIFSADVFPDIEEARKTKMQDWALWARKRYIDFLAPMIYTPNALQVKTSVAGIRAVAGKNFPVYAGLAPFLNLTPEILLKEIESARSLSTRGVILFATQSLSDEQLNLFAAGPFRTAAATGVSQLYHDHQK